VKSFWDLTPKEVLAEKQNRWIQLREGRVMLGMGLTLFPTEFVGNMGPAVGRFLIGRGKAGERVVLAASAMTSADERLEEEFARRFMTYTPTEADDYLKLLGK
jgi:hypothetical protein